MVKKALLKKVIVPLCCFSLLLGLAGCASGGSSGATMAPAGDTGAAAPSMADPGEDGYGFCEEEEDWYYPYDDQGGRYAPIEGEEEYDNSPESPFKAVASSPISTFSSDVDTASYSNMRRFIRMGQQPEGVRIEELVNYFDYSYPRPKAGAEHPFTVSTRVAPCPWQKGHQLAMVGIQGAELEQEDEIRSNIVFLIDVSGSMEEAEKLPLLQESFSMLVGQLDKDDRVSIVTYAGNDSIVADSVPGNEHRQLRRALDNLYAGGSTAGENALRSAYRLARENYIQGGNNRIILATDGDFNVGESSTDAMLKLVEEEREKGVFVSVLGFGMGNLKDNLMETIADNGNGNYAYIDTLQEAKKVLVDEFESTLFTIAKDLKLQVHFNPDVVGQYRLIGYNNRRMENEDFNDDTKDAGDIGAGHSVTAFYELIPAGEATEGDLDQPVYTRTNTTGSTDFMTIKLRYKAPEGDSSILLEAPVGEEAYSDTLTGEFAFASAVAEFGLVVSDSRFQGESNVDEVIRRARKYQGEDLYGLREEFISLAENYQAHFA